MAAQKFDFAREGCQGAPCEVGATFSYGLIWSADPGNTGNFSPVDLTGYSARMQVRPNPGDPNLIVELNTTNGRIVLGGTLGTINLVIPATLTSTFAPGLYKYDLDLMDGNGFVTRFISGFFEVVAAVTV